MTSLVTDATESTMRSGTLESITTTTGLVAVVLLLALLVEREIVRTIAGPHVAARLRVLNVVTVPVMLVVIVVIGARLGALR